MAKSDLIHVHVEGNVFEGKSDELAKFLENGGKAVDSQGNAVYGNGALVVTIN